MKIYEVVEEDKLVEVETFGESHIGFANHTVFSSIDRAKINGPFSIYFWRRGNEPPVCLLGGVGEEEYEELRKILGFGVLFCLRVSSDGYKHIWFD
jgi:hypothetical protein